jgi:hypothetical protein
MWGPEYGTKIHACWMDSGCAAAMVLQANTHVWDVIGNAA